MKKFNKKIALILVLTLILAASIPALAASTTTIMGQYQLPVLEVVVPTTGQIVINPFSLPVKINAEDSKTSLGKLTDPGQIATKPLIGYSVSEVDLQIGATVIGEETGDFKFSATAPTTETTKIGQVYLQVCNPKADFSYTLTVDTTAAKSTTVCKGVNGAAALAALNRWGNPDYTASTDLLISATAESTNEDMCRLKGTDDPTTPDDEGYFMARLGGVVVKKPAEDWTASDGLKATVTWIIQPPTTP